MSKFSELLDVITGHDFALKEIYQNGISNRLLFAIVDKLYNQNKVIEDIANKFEGERERYQDVYREELDLEVASLAKLDFQVGMTTQKIAAFKEIIVSVSDDSYSISDESSNDLQSIVDLEKRILNVFMKFSALTILIIL